jgi:signal recognition particle subunit SRP54
LFCGYSEGTLNLVGAISSLLFTTTTTGSLKLLIEAYALARRENHDVILIDTAGRLAIDTVLMDELKALKEATNPNEILLVVDAMSGQDAVNVAKIFHEYLNVTGAVMTKLDGDARGGAALSIASISGIKIKFTGTGEKVTDLDVFHPERMANRILGMGDVVELVEKAQEQIDEQQAKKLANKMLSGKFDLQDMLMQIESTKKMGPLGSLAKLIPGMPKISDAQAAQAEARLKKTRVVIQSMTLEERRNPDLIKGSRKIRIANGCGLTSADVNLVLKQYEQQKQQMKQLSMMFRGRKLF